ncbi:hypothetical protein BV20DRAFT_971757 [Pilatotrama ljubarskyi]|nr:hypothetical protein BV20DRAFT_971757 [Pilatotrama ljubarskyi]
MSKVAAALKEEGNKLFKGGELARAVELYTQAEKADPTDPVYPSNLSAALYEIADYAGAVDAVLRAWEKLRGKADAKPDLVPRLSSRLAKALCLGVRARTISRDILLGRKADIWALRDAGIKGLEEGNKSTIREELLLVWKEWDATEPDVDSFVQKSDAALAALSRMPLFSKPLDDRKENYGIGTDPIINLMDGWGPNSTDPDPLELHELPEASLSELAFLFGGVGDGRHTLGTVSGLHKAYRNLPGDKQRLFHAHLTMLDIHDGTVARDLCMLMLLDELTNASEAGVRTEIIVTLMYTFLAPVMPSYCYDRLQSVMRDLQRRLITKPPSVPAWIHVHEEAIPAILGTLQYWLATEKSTHTMLANHVHRNPEARRRKPDVVLERTRNLQLQWMRDESEAENRRELEAALRSMTDEKLATMPFVPPGASPAQARAFVEKHMELLLDAMQDMNQDGRVAGFEELWYEQTKVFLPPEELRSRHPGFDAAWTQVKRRSGQVDVYALRNVLAHVLDDWKANITLFDPTFNNPRYHPDGDGYPDDLHFDAFELVGYMADFNRQKGREDRRRTSIDMDTLTWEVASTFFTDVADALRGLRGRILVELICGGLPEELAKMRFKGDVTRPPEFPRKFTRMWLSNVPDYTHGPMNMAIYVVPNLQDHAQAAVACNCLLNMSVWTDDHEYFHTYTHMLPEYIPRYLGCRIVRWRAVMEVLTMGPRPLPMPYTELAPKAELTSWLTRVLFNAFITGHSREPPQNVRLPHSLVAFFGLLMHLHRVGYPAHWLSDFLARVLSGRMISDIAPYTDEWPIPLQDLDRRVPLRTVRTDPWLVEFENIVATADYAIPFAIATSLPPGFVHDPDDIQVWEALLTATLPFSTTWNEFTRYMSPYEPVSRLLFYRPSLVVPQEVINNMRSVFEGRWSPPVGSFFVLTAQELLRYQDRVRFRLSRKRVEKMKAEKWRMLVYRNDTGDIATRPVPVSDWVPVPMEI